MERRGWNMPFSLDSSTHAGNAEQKRAAGEAALFNNEL
jgi:hypothetical protein